jgi:hypothetical protein
MPAAVSGLEMNPSASGGTEPDRTGHSTPSPAVPPGPSAGTRLSTAMMRITFRTYDG